MNKEIIVRIPPSPTGLLHVGTVRTALFNYLFAKKNKGKIVFRFEDTDIGRSKKEFEDDILNGLEKLGLDFDEGPFWQTERTDIYKIHLETLLKNGSAYFCFCSKEELEKKREEQIAKKLPPRHECNCKEMPKEKVKARLNNNETAVVRFKVPESRDVIFNDLVRGEVKINTREISDFVIARSLDSPLYNYCVVIDDHEMQITHIIRGEDGISNTPKQILIYEAFGWEIPQFAHLPLILNADRSKLSKRKNKVSVNEFLEDGILPEALINFLALTGWNTADEKEIFTLEELIQEFDLARVQKGGAIFDEKRLLWINGVWIRQKPLEEFKEFVKPYLEKANIDYLKKGEEFFKKALLMVQERMKKLSESAEFLGFFFNDNLEYDKQLFVHEKMNVDIEHANTALIEAENVLTNIDEKDWTEENLEEKLVELIKKLSWKNGQLLWPVRVALTGEKFSPGVFELLSIFGKTESLKRIAKGKEILEK